MEYSYYPGCSLHSTGWEYNESVQSVFKTLDVRLTELEDWNCCGASSAHAISHELALGLPARNLAIAQGAGKDIVMPCAACFNRHKSADFEMRTNPERRAEFEKMFNFTYQGNVTVRALLDVVANKIGLDRIRAAVKVPLTGLKVVSYYGCLLVRPPEVTEFENPDHPVLMDQILEALGAQPLPWGYATECCGGGLSLTKRDAAQRLVNRLSDRAREAGAEAIATSCPLCQVNLEMRQQGKDKMPIFYFTELMGVAFGAQGTGKWWAKHLINPKPLLEARGFRN